jgi:hypothetical protein
MTGFIQGFVPQNTGQELVPPTVYNQTEVAILQSPNMVGMWSNNQGWMQGAVSNLSYVWQDEVSLQQMLPAISGQTPNLQTTSGGLPFAGFGYGTGTGPGATLKQSTTTLAAAALHVGGSGYAVNDTITLNDGGTTHTVLTVTQVSSGVILNFTVTVYGLGITSQGAVGQLSTSGSGTGATFDLSVGTANGSLITPVLNGISANSPVTMWAVARMPAPNGYAGATPGGCIFSNALPQTTVSPDFAANGRLLGLTIGNTGAPGSFVFRINGDLDALTTPTTDYRDGNWHMYMGTVTPSSGTTVPTKWVDGTQVETVSLSNLTLNSAPGYNQLRIGAAGAPNAPAPNFGFAGDIGHCVFVSADLSGSGGLAQRQLIGNYLLSQYQIGGQQN